MFRFALLPVFCLLLLLPAASQTSLNMTLLSQWDPAGLTYNDCWGYTDSNGREYAIIGSREKIHFLDITNPMSPVLADEVSNGDPGGITMGATTWRDFKTYSHYCYAASERFGEGLLIFDMNSLPDSVTFVLQTTSFFDRTHNIFIDTNSGRLYAAGTNSRSNGLVVLDLTSNPANPTLLASVPLPPGNYVHDVYVRGDTAYCSHGNNGFFIWDFSNPASPVLLGDLTTNGYNHSSWVTPDGQYAFWAEEVPAGLPMGVTDISDPANMTIDHTFKFPLLAPLHLDNTPHNPFIRDSFLIVSYYEDGVQVFNISDPLAPAQVAYYDTEPNNTTYNGTRNNWGVYPYFPSNAIIASDVVHGLFVLQLNAQLVPLELGEFSGRLQEGQILLDWETLAELNLSHFEVEREWWGEGFQKIGRVEASGHSASRLTYAFADQRPLPGQNYYRLRSVDEDGTYTYSKVIAVENPFSDVQVFPTSLPGGHPLRIILPDYMEQAEVRLFSSAGQFLRSKIVTKDGTQLETEGLPPGIYYLQLEGGVVKEIFITTP